MLAYPLISVKTHANANNKKQFYEEKVIVDLILNIFMFNL